MTAPGGDRLRALAIRANRVLGAPLRKLGIDLKKRYELAYWLKQHKDEGELRRGWYRAFYTKMFDLDGSFYRSARVLDVGCGPRGSLEWAARATVRVGLDPLVDDYRELGIAEHEMSYVCAPAERMPFADAAFDVVASINSLDHVDDLDGAIAEITRVLCPGGTFLLVVDVHDVPTIAEPQSIPWNLVEWLRDDFEVVSERHLERARREGYSAEQVTFDHDDPTERYGLLVLRAVRRPTS